MANPIHCYDFTLKECDRNIVTRWLKENCKHWCFQLEEGEKTGYRHYQGRFSLKVKARISTLLNRKDAPPEGIHLTPTSNQNMGNDWYVSKEETRLDGPWKDTDPEIFIPRQCQIEEWRPWQQYIFDRYREWDPRGINIVLDEGGNKGKSVLVTRMCVLGMSQMIPPCNDIRDTMRMILDTRKEVTPESNNGFKWIYFVDFPKALGKDKIATFMAGLEMLKNGYCYDDRYTFKEGWMNSPNIWVFTNKLPNMEYLSADRWRLWKITRQQQLVNLSVEEEGVEYK